MPEEALKLAGILVWHNNDTCREASVILRMTGVEDAMDHMRHDPLSLRVSDSLRIIYNGSPTPVQSTTMSMPIVDTDSIPAFQVFAHTEVGYATAR
jgi:hypothetical protein